MVLTVPYGQADALCPAPEIQRVIPESGDGKVVVAFHLLPQRSEVRKQIFALQRMDLRHRLSFAANHGVILLRYPEHAVEQPLAVQNLPGLNLDYPTIHA